MIIFVGDKIKLGGLVQAAENRLHEEAFFIDENYNICKQENDILLAANTNTTCIVYDTEQYINDGEQIIQIVKRIYRANKIKPVLLVPTNNPNNEILKAALANQIKNFVNTAKPLGDQKDEFEKIYTDYYAANERTDIAEAEEQVKEEVKTLNEFVGELYDAKQREVEKENTVIIRKKGNIEAFLDFIKGSIRILAIVLIDALAVLGLISLCYSNIRPELLRVLLDIYNQILQMIGG